MKFLFTLLIMFYVQLTCAVTIELSAIKDNTLYETNLKALSNGAGIYFFAGRTAEGMNDLRRGLIQFDLSSIPLGSTINDATLEITSSRTIAGLRDISIHHALSDWGESNSNATSMGGGIGALAEPGDATWTNAFHDGASWATVGGDFDPTADAITAISGTVTACFNAVALTNRIQAWYDNPETNFGWVVIGDESEDTTAFRFNTRENPVTPPKLIIDYSLPNVQLSPTKDNTLYEDLTGSISNGAGDSLFIGRVNTGNIRRAVIEFDLSTIPSNATIASVQLDLTINTIPGSAQAGTAALHKTTTEWGESTSNGGGMGAPAATGDATWLHTFYDTNQWANAGGDFDLTATATSDFTDISTELTFNDSAALRSDVTTWVRNSDDNHGWILQGDEVNAGNPRSLNSRETLSPPMLTIAYYVLPDFIFSHGFEND